MKFKFCNELNLKKVHKCSAKKRDPGQQGVIESRKDFHAPLIKIIFSYNFFAIPAKAR